MLVSYSPVLCTMPGLFNILRMATLKFSAFRHYRWMWWRQYKVRECSLVRPFSYGTERNQSDHYICRSPHGTYHRITFINGRLFKCYLIVIIGAELALDRSSRIEQYFMEPMGQCSKRATTTPCSKQGKSSSQAPIQFVGIFEYYTLNTYNFTWTVIHLLSTRLRCMCFASVPYALLAHHTDHPEFVTVMTSEEVKRLGNSSGCNFLRFPYLPMLFQSILLGSIWAEDFGVMGG
jgi:hypothetical protein